MKSEIRNPKSIRVIVSRFKFFISDLFKISDFRFQIYACLVFLFLTACSTVEERQQRAIDAFQDAKNTASGATTEVLERAEQLKKLGKDTVESIEMGVEEIEGRIDKVQKGAEMIKEGKELIKEGVGGN